VRRALRVAQERSSKNHAESTGNARGYGSSREIETICDDPILPLGENSRTVAQRSNPV